jgi:hypothetical protein
MATRADLALKFCTDSKKPSGTILTLGINGTRDMKRVLNFNCLQTPLLLKVYDYEKY